MAEIRFTELDPTDDPGDDDVFAIADVTAEQSKKLRYGDLRDKVVDAVFGPSGDLTATSFTALGSTDEALTVAPTLIEGAVRPGLPGSNLEIRTAAGGSGGNKGGNLDVILGEGSASVDGVAGDGGALEQFAGAGGDTASGTAGSGGNLRMGAGNSGNVTGGGTPGTAGSATWAGGAGLGGADGGPSRLIGGSVFGAGAFAGDAIVEGGEVESGGGEPGRVLIGQNNTRAILSGDGDTPWIHDGTFTSRPPIEVDDSAEYTLAEADNGRVIVLLTECEVLVPDGLKSGFNCVIVQGTNDEPITVSAEDSAELIPGTPATSARGDWLVLFHLGSDVYKVSGDLA